jgi:hypothetical protein
MQWKSNMKRYLIERHIPGVGGLSLAQLKALAATSNDAIAKLSGQVQWVHSHIAADNTFCIYLADSEDLIREHSRLAGFPITRVNEVVTVIDPTTAS